jgi:ParB family chromosome partitioning protein
MNRITLPIHEIKVEDRQRQDLGNITELAESLKQFGLIQPVVISQDKRLLAGGRRLAAALLLGWTDIDVVYKNTLSLDEAFEIELEENVRRKDMSWQERCLTILKIHDLKKRNNALNGEAWGMRETAELLGSSKSNVHYCIAVARALAADKESPLWKEPTLADAWKLILRAEQDAIQAELRRRQLESVSTEPTLGLSEYTSLDDLPTVEDVDLEKENARERYLSNKLNDPDKFDEYWSEKQAFDNERRTTIRLGNVAIHGDCIPYMLAHAECYDHIVTDIPYGIDMSMLAQQNTGMVDLDTVEEEHDVDENKALMARFFPAAFTALKDNGFLITCCDTMLWQYMYELALAAGFKVQRWPIVWHKLNRCSNQAAQYNFTKDIELAMVCRKGNAVIMNHAPTCVVTASNDEMCKLTGHKFAKPRELWKFFLTHISFDNQLVLDPFAGRGSSLISGMEMNRRMVGVELNDVHYNALLENLRTYFSTFTPNAKFV